MWCLLGLPLIGCAQKKHLAIIAAHLVLLHVGHTLGLPYHQLGIGSQTLDLAKGKAAVLFNALDRFSAFLEVVLARHFQSYTSTRCQGVDELGVDAHDPPPFVASADSGLPIPPVSRRGG